MPTCGVAALNGGCAREVLWTLRERRASRARFLRVRGGVEVAGLSDWRDSKPCIVAEISANHKGTLSAARRLIAAAAEAGADMVKIQSYRADSLTIRSDRPEFRVSHPLWRGRSLYDLYSEGSTPRAWHKDLWREAERCGVRIFASVFDKETLGFLESFSPIAYKVASAELVDLPLIAEVARKGRPLVLSTGMGGEEDIAEAVACARAEGAAEVILLHCLSAYPAKVERMNLRAMETLRRRFSCPIGLSDHTQGSSAAIAAVALGAEMIEKHLTLKREEGDLDGAFSLQPDEFAEFVGDIRMCAEGMGDGILGIGEGEEESLMFRRSLYVVRSLRCGEVIGEEHIRSIRPSLGLAPKHYRRVLGARAARDVSAGVPLQEGMFIVREGEDG